VNYKTCSKLEARKNKKPLKHSLSIISGVNFVGGRSEISNMLREDIERISNTTLKF